MLQVKTEPKINFHVGHPTGEKRLKQLKWNVSTEFKQVRLTCDRLMVVPHFNQIY